jgi:UDP-N-acetylmuramoyl-tripeptide--D-alanyl-D-alanine ligase
VLEALELPFTSAHMRRNAQAAVAAARAVGVEPSGAVDLELSAMRGQVRERGDGVAVIDDCYNANPLSMRAALDDLATKRPAGRRVAVLGDMLELGPAEREEHRAIGAHAQASDVDVLVTVGPLAAEMAQTFAGEVHSVADAAEAAALVRGLVAPGDLVLVKASRGVALEAVTEALAA